MGKLSTKGVEPVRYLTDDKDHHVYYLPEEHYVGITSQKDVRHRVNKQRYLGMKTNGWRVLQTFNTREEARHYENLWHSWLGTNGINING